MVQETDQRANAAAIGGPARPGGGVRPAIAEGGEEREGAGGQQKPSAEKNIERYTIL